MGDRKDARVGVVGVEAVWDAFTAADAVGEVFRRFAGDASIVMLSPGLEVCTLIVREAMAVRLDDELRRALVDATNILEVTRQDFF